jgi:hypothetical protein
MIGRTPCALALALATAGASCSPVAGDDAGRGQPGYDAALSDSARTDAGSAGDGAAADGGSANLPRYWQAYCGLLERCRPSWGRVFYDVTACEETLQAAFLAGIDPELRRYDEPAGQSCIPAIQSASCDLFVASPVAACPAAFAGDKSPLGESCEQRLCASGLYCDADQAAGYCPVCATPGGNGAGCSESPAHPCDGEHYCDLQRQCALKKADGIDCSSDVECSSDFCRGGICRPPLGRDVACGAADRCAYHLVCRAGTCTDLGGSGDACASHADCMPLTHACHGGSCQPYQVGVAAEIGATCGNSGTCSSGNYCDQPAGECRLLVALDGACTQSEQCGPDAHCSHDSRCAAFAQVSAPCSDAICATGGYCTTDSNPVCMPTKPDGALCTGSWECQSGYCDSARGVCSMPAACVKP